LNWRGDSWNIHHNVASMIGEAKAQLDAVDSGRHPCLKLKCAVAESADG
jgi:hypothetical protein